MVYGICKFSIKTKKLQENWKLNVGPSGSYLDAVTTEAVDHGTKPAKAALIGLRPQPNQQSLTIWVYRELEYL